MKVGPIVRQIKAGQTTTLIGVVEQTLKFDETEWVFTLRYFPGGETIKVSVTVSAVRSVGDWFLVCGTLGRRYNRRRRYYETVVQGLEVIGLNPFELRRQGLDLRGLDGDAARRELLS